MWVWLSRRFRRWLVLAVGVPVLAWVLGRLGEELEARQGRSRTSELLRSGSARLDRERRGFRRRRSDTDQYPGP